MRIVIVLFALLGLARAEEPAPKQAAPHAPFVAPVPDYCHWAIKITNPPASGDPKSHATAVPVEIQSARTKELKMDLVKYSDGTSKQTWFYGKQMIFPYEGGKNLGSVNASFLMDQAAFGPCGNLVNSLGFPGLSWVGLKWFKDVVSIKGTDCFHYSAELEAEGKKVSAEAWIAVESGLPVVARFDSVGHAYEFFPPPSAMLQLPPEYAAVAHQDEVREQQVRALQKMR